ncbi:MAG: hypothetical protein IIV43_04215, partial [Oscillospiraceae bacterium]|nr:hypothetical protein [Oscillospiraceae bacterium]
MRKLIKNELLISILFFTTTVAIFGPLELYITNKADLWFNFKDVVTISLILSAISVLALGALGFCLKGKHKNLFCSVVFALTLCLYLQGNYLNISYGLLDGRTIDWSNYTKYAVFNTSLWIFIIGGLFYLRKKFPAVFHKIHVYGSLLIISMQIITLGVLMVSNDIFVPDTSIEHSLSADHITHVGDGDNIIVFVLDAFDDHVALQSRTLVDMVCRCLCRVASHHHPQRPLHDKGS